MTDVDFLNATSREIVNQIKDFEATLPDNMQVGMVINGGVIVIENVLRLFRLGAVIIRGFCAIPFPPLKEGDSVRVGIESRIPNLILTAVPRTEGLSKPKKKIGFRVEDGEPLQD